jgi:hypothetical protein
MPVFFAAFEKWRLSILAKALRRQYCNGLSQKYNVD